MKWATTADRDGDCSIFTPEPGRQMFIGVGCTPGQSVRIVEKHNEDDDKLQALRSALLALLDAMDFTAGNCQPNQSVGAVVDAVLISNARRAINDTA